MTVLNCYADARRANAYAALTFPGTYSLAYRDLPAIFARHVAGTRAIDFGCGTGRSTRFLRDGGFRATGIDIAPEMLRQATRLDPRGDYRLIADGRFLDIPDGAFDLALSAFTFDNIPAEAKLRSLGEIARVLDEGGVFVNIVSSPDLYRHEWLSFSTKDFPENWLARDGDVVRDVITDIDDPRPVEDILWSDAAYRVLFARAGLSLVDVQRPLGRPDEPYPWVNETRIAPWTIYVLKKAQGSGLRAQEQSGSRHQSRLSQDFGHEP